MSMLNVSSPLPCLGVVPVFVNAGAALLPAIIAALTSIVSLVFRPRMLWQACKARPGMAAAVLAAIAAGSAVVAWWLVPADTIGPRRKAASSQAAGSMPLGAGRRIDWAAMAIQWLREEKLSATASPDPPKTPANGGAPAAPGPVARATILGGGPLRNSYAGGGSPLGLMPAWSFPMPGSPAAGELEGAMFLASPAVVGDAVCGGSCLLDVQRNYGTVFCLDAKSGSPRWSTATYKDDAGRERDFKGFFSSPAVSADGNYLVIGQGLHNDEDCDLLCFRAKTGRLHWRVRTPLHIEGSPAIDGDLAVAGAGAVEVGEDHHAKGHPGLVLAVRVSTGEKLWEYQVNDPESSPDVADGVAYVGSGVNGNAVVALRTQPDDDLKKRKLERLLWRTPTPYPATGAVTLAGELLLVGCGNGDYVLHDPHPEGAVIALERTTGRLRWKVPMPDGVLGTIAVRGDRAIVPVRNGQIAAIDLGQSGKVLWWQRFAGQKAILAGPAFTGKYVYAVSQDGCLAVLDAGDGKLLQKQQLNARDKPGEMGLCVSSPAVAGGRVYVGSETGGLRCFVAKEIKE
jgi:outer membrane protein assembly factor BamB